jgi:molybdopterin/thiamine biosynthesis adenylyltransferase
MDFLGMLTDEERQRYSRQMMLSGFGEEGQKKLREANVSIVGIGGLGCTVSIQLTLAGIGQLSLIDYGRVERSNLNRQNLYDQEDIGQFKVDVAREKLARLNPNVQIEADRTKIDEDNVCKILGGCALVVDGLDTLDARYALNKFALFRNLPLVHGGVYGYEGRVTTIIPGKTPCLKCLYHVAQKAGEVPIFGAVPAVIGSLQSLEVTKYILGIGRLLAGRLMIYDGLSQKFVEVQTQFDPHCTDCSVLFSGKKTGDERSD